MIKKESRTVFLLFQSSSFFYVSVAAALLRPCLTRTIKIGGITKEKENPSSTTQVDIYQKWGGEIERSIVHVVLCKSSNRI